TEDEFSIPGSPAQEALDHLNHVIPQTSGSQGQLVVVAPAGKTITDPAVRTTIERAIDRIEQAPQVNGVVNPFADDVDDMLSSDDRAAIVQLQMAGQPAQIEQTTKDQLHRIVDQLTDRLG